MPIILLAKQRALFERWWRVEMPFGSN